MNNDNEFLSLINSQMLKVSDVVRYSGLYQARPESLDTHIVDVSLLSYAMALRLKFMGQEVNIGRLLEKCLIHDLDESYSSDIPRLVKYSSKECHDALNKVANKAMQKMSYEIGNDDYVYDIWRNDKDHTIEGYLLRISDMMSVAKKVVNEVLVLNNKGFLRVAMEMESYVKDLIASEPSDLFANEACYKYISDILVGSLTVLKHIVIDNLEIIKSLNITDCTISDIISSRYKEESDN